MEMHQIRYFLAVSRLLNFTRAAEECNVSQSALTRAIKALEDELGVPIFVRRGKRFVGLTESGTALLPVIERILGEVENLRRVAKDYAGGDTGSITIATTHTQARYALPKVVSEFKRRYPQVHLGMLQGNPSQVAEFVLHGEADLGIATEALDSHPGLIALPGYTWHHIVVVREDHPLAALAGLALEQLAAYPLITYEPAFTGRTHIDAAFAARGLAPDIVIAAIDSDVIKTYVELGMGVGIIASMAYDRERDRGLAMIDAGHLFKPNTTRIAIRRDVYLRGFVYEFIARFAPHLTRKVIDQALAGGHENYEL